MSRITNAEATVVQELNQGSPRNSGEMNCGCPFLVLFWASKKGHI